MAENKKPDYTDMDWTALKQERIDKWNEMMEGLSKEGWKYFPVREAEGFQAGLALHPIHEGGRRGIFLVCAGGGFMFKSSNEAKPVAEYFYEKGFNTAILDYHVDPATPMGQSVEVQRSARADGLAAIRFLRAKADELGILGDKIAIGGFSAGGMLSAGAATEYDLGEPDSEDPLRRVSSRPDAALILYGAMSMSGIQDVGMFSFDSKKQAELAKADPMRRIHPDCPPMFVFQTHADDPRHALLFCYQLACNGVPYEIHTFEEGGHGGGLYNGGDEDTPDVPHTAHWADLAAEWLASKGFLG